MELFSRFWLNFINVFDRFVNVLYICVVCECEHKYQVIVVKHSV